MSYDLLFRNLARTCHYSKSDALALTLSQALNLLSDADPHDPHSGGVEIKSSEAWDEMIRRLQAERD